MPRDFKTILCPTDFSEDSCRAIEYGVRFARVSDGTLLLAHIIHVPSGELYQPERPTLNFDEATARARALLEDIQQKRTSGYPKCELLVEIGDPYEQLLAIVKRRNVDLIVTATHGRSGIEHLVLGSVAEKVIRHAPCPVFVVRRGAT
jgi:universal stress protein A